MNQLDAAIKDADSKAKLNYRISYAVYIAAFLGSLAGTLVPLLATGDGARKTGAVVALLPAIALSVMASFRFNRKSDWHSEHKAKLQEIERQMRIKPYEKVPELIDCWNYMEREMARHWPGFGELPGAPHQGPDKPRN
ncbi:hypothetical protein [Paraburkholderia sp. GAS448]|uniref:hypothetical protein n=1 Tax=Paraburkholderia sp. GAS448 TaxID=3035136 RepID=UPI003D2371D5